MSTSAERMRRLRQRRAALLEAVPDAPPRDADDLLLPAVEQTIEALQLGAEGAAVAQLARLYARRLDEAQDQALALRVFGGAFLRVLTAMGATPAARAGVRPERPQRPNQLARLRAEHARRR